MVEKPQNRIESLDSIRGLAALAVLLFHTVTLFIWPMNWVSWTDWPVLNMAFDGRSAVAMFFVLSGFVLSRPYVCESGATLSLLSFYVKRFARIYLPWLFVFIVSLVTYHFFFQKRQTNPPVNYWFWRQNVPFGDIARQLIFQLPDPGLRMLPQDWSLGVELKGSALIPLLVFLARRRHDLFWLGLTSVVFFFFNLRSGSFFISFVIGVVLARYNELFNNRLKQLKFYQQVLFLLAGMLLYESSLIAKWTGSEGWLSGKLVWIVCSFGCMMILSSCLASRRITAFLVTRPVLWIGQVSYSIYLVQFLVLFFLLPATILGLNKLGISQTFWMLPLSFFMGVAPTLIFARLMYSCVEIPSIKLGRWLASHF